MGSTDHSNVDARAAARFGLGALVVLGAVAAWLALRRHAPIAALVLAASGGSLALLGLVAPTRALQVRAAWMAIARAIGKVNGAILLTVVFALVITPLGLLRRLRSKERWVAPPPRGAPRSYWSARAPADDPAADARHYEHPWS